MMSPTPRRRRALDVLSVVAAAATVIPAAIFASRLVGLHASAISGAVSVGAGAVTILGRYLVERHESNAEQRQHKTDEPPR